MNEQKTPAHPKAQKKINWLQWVMVLAFALVGFFFAGLMIDTMETAEANGASGGRVALLWILLMVGMYAVIFGHIVVHEGGHLVFGLLNGYRFVSFRVGSLMLLKNEQGYHLRRMRLGGTGGQCLLDPPQIVDGRMPNVLYNLGGCLMNLLVGAVSVGIAFLCPDGSPGRALLILSGIIGLMYALLNGLPMKGDMPNDGRNAMELGKDPEALQAFRTQLVLNRLSAEGLRLRDMPEEYFAWPSEESLGNALVASSGIICCSRLLDENRFDECAARIDELLAGTQERLPTLFRRLLINDRICLHLLAGEKETAAALMDKEQQQFCKTMKGQLPIHRTEYAFALLAEEDAQKAEKALKAFDKAANGYPHPQEVEAERELMALVQATAAAGAE